MVFFVIVKPMSVINARKPAADEPASARVPGVPERDPGRGPPLRSVHQRGDSVARLHSGRGRPPDRGERDRGAACACATFTGGAAEDHAWRGSVGIGEAEVVVDVRTGADGRPYVHVAAPVTTGRASPGAGGTAAGDRERRARCWVASRTRAAACGSSTRSWPAQRWPRSRCRPSVWMIGWAADAFAPRLDALLREATPPPPAPERCRRAAARRGQPPRDHRPPREAVPGRALRRIRARPGLGIPRRVRQRAGVRGRAAGAGELDGGARLVAGAVGHRSERRAGDRAASAVDRSGRSAATRTSRRGARSGSSMRSSATTSTGSSWRRRSRWWLEAADGDDDLLAGGSAARVTPTSAADRYQGAACVSSAEHGCDRGVVVIV